MPGSKMNKIASGSPNPQLFTINQYKHTVIRLLAFVSSILFGSAISTITFAVTANPDSAITAINSAVTIAVLSNDTLDDGSSAAASSDTAVCLDAQLFNSLCSSNEILFTPSSPENGTLSLSGNNVIYTPNEGFTGTDSFIYGVFFQEPDANPQADDSTVLITVSPAKSPTKEEQELKDAIISLCDSASNESLANNCSALNNLSETDEAAALVTLAADQVTAGFTSTLGMTRDQSANITSRITQLRNDSNGINVQGLTLNNHGEKLNGEWLHALYNSMTNEKNNTSLAGGSAGEDTDSKVYSPFGFFINGSITLGDKDSSSSERGYDLDSDNYTFGIDYRYNDQLVVGAAYGYSSSSIEFNSTGDDMDNQINTLFLYGSLYDDNFYLSSTLGYSFGEIDTARRILIPSTLDTRAKGNTDTDQFILQVSGSYDYYQEALSYGPYAKLDIIEGEIDSYTERNGGGFEVVFDDQDISSQLFTIGGQAQYALSYSWGVLLPNARFEIKNEFNDSRDAINGRFALDPTNSNFSITADKIDNFWFVFGGGFSAVFPHGFSAYADLETVQGLEDLSLYTYSYGGRWELTF